MKNQLFHKMILLVFLFVLFVPQNAFAYLGPGSGLSAIGSFLALIGTVIIAIIGFLWFPIKRLIRKKKALEPDQVKSKEE